MSDCRTHCCWGWLDLFNDWRWVYVWESADSSTSCDPQVPHSRTLLRRETAISNCSGGYSWELHEGRSSLPLLSPINSFIEAHNSKNTMFSSERKQISLDPFKSERVFFPYCYQYDGISNICLEDSGKAVFWIVSCPTSAKKISGFLFKPARSKRYTPLALYPKELIDSSSPPISSH